MIDAHRFDAIARKFSGRFGRRTLVGGVAAALIPGVGTAQAGELDCSPCGYETCPPGGPCFCTDIVEDCLPEQCSGCCIETTCGSRCVWTPDDNACGAGGEWCQACGTGQTCRADGVCKRKRTKRSRKRKHRR